MSKVISKAGTTIVFEKSDFEPAVVIVGGILGDRAQQAPLAALLSEHFSVFNYDRRGHGESGDKAPYAVEREIEDLEAVINEAGGSAFVYGTSGCGVLAMHAAAAGLSPRFKKLAVWESPFILEQSGRNPPRNYKEQITEFLTQGRRGDMFVIFMIVALVMREEFVSRYT